MSTVSNLIFNGKEHRMSSPFGKRAVMQTSAGKTSSFHSGVDYSTGGKKLTQYAIADGTVESCGKASDGANFVWVSYPTLKVRMLHYHLDSIKVTKGQKVTKGTVLGTTGKTGKATGIHLHLGIKEIGKDSWIDAEKWSAEVFDKQSEKVVEKTETTTRYEVTTNLLNVRKGAGMNFAVKKYTELSKDAQKQIKELSNGRTPNGYVKGLKCSVSEISGEWGKTPSGWINLNYCKKI